MVSTSHLAPYPTANILFRQNETEVEINTYVKNNCFLETVIVVQFIVVYISDIAAYN